MPTKLKILRRKHLNKIISVILHYIVQKNCIKKLLAIKNLKVDNTQIFTMNIKKSSKLYYKTKYNRQCTKLNICSKRFLICYVDQFLYNNFAAFSNLFKYSYLLSQKIV